MNLTLDRVILHTVMHHSSTSTYMPNFIEIEETFCGRTYGRVDGHLRPTLLGRLGGVHLKVNSLVCHHLCLILGSEVCNHRWVTAGWHPRQINLPTAVNEKNVAAILPADTRFVCHLWQMLLIFCWQFFYGFWFVTAHSATWAKFC